MTNPSPIPGKAFLFGEHAVVFPGHSAVVIPISDVSCRATVIPDATPRFSIEQMRAYLVSARNNFALFDESSDIQHLRIYKEPSNYLKLLMSLTADYLERRGVTILPTSVLVDSSIPVGGMGSSAAIAAAVIEALALHHKVVLDRSDLYQLSLTAEHFQHGRSSGSDVAAVVYQRPVRVTNTGDTTNTVTVLDPAAIPAQLMANCYILHTGRPAQSTGDMVAFVSLQHRRDPAPIETIGTITQAFLDDVEAGTLTEARFWAAINANGRLLESLGVVTPMAMDISRRIRDHGGAAKLSGAGGLGNGPAGALLVYLTDQSLLKELSNQYDVYHA